MGDLPDGLVGRAHRSIDPLHSLGYFAPETEQELVALGLERGRQCYVAGRAAPMGAVGAGVVTATFYNYAPVLIAACVPSAWEVTTPEAVVAAKRRAIDAAWRRLLSAEGGPGVDFPEMAECADLTAAAASACRPEGRPLHAAYAALDWPSEQHLAWWHAITLLREHRGDGHVAALDRAGLSGLEALVTHSATGHGFVPQAARRTRGWTQEQWDDAVAALRSRGLLGDGLTLTAAGSALRTQVEQDTDALAAAPWEHLGAERTQRLVDLARPLARRVVAAGAFPPGVFQAR